MMKYFSRLVSFESEDGQKRFFADLGSVSDVPAQGASISAYESFQDLLEGKNEVTAVIGKVRSLSFRPSKLRSWGISTNH